MTKIQQVTDAEAIKSALAQIRLNARRTIALPPTEMREKSRQAVVDWINSWDADWDVACCWHTSKTLRKLQNGHDEQWLQRQLSAYFSKLIKRVYTHIPHKHRPHISRFITLEHNDYVGWHAHGVIATPSHMSQDQFIAILEELWVEQAGVGSTEAFKRHLCWFQPLTGNYKHYMLKSAINLHDDLPENFRGFIDLHNTRRQ